MEEDSTNKDYVVQMAMKEIELNIVNRFNWRNKSNFSLFISPFVLLGAYLVSQKENFKIPDLSGDLGLVIAILVIYILIGFSCAGVEDGLMKRNNLLRKFISKRTNWVSGGSNVTNEDNGADQSNFALDEILTKDRSFLFASYFAVYFLLIVEFCLICWLLFNITTKG